MDTMKAIAMGEANRHREQMVFDWQKAARLIKERNAKCASAGLKNDWEWTGGVIWNGEPVHDRYTYLASTWATPQIDIDGEIIDCYVMAGQTTYDHKTKWPQEALEIVA